MVPLGITDEKPLDCPSSLQCRAQKEQRRWCWFLETINAQNKVGGIVNVAKRTLGHWDATCIWETG